MAVVVGDEDRRRLESDEAVGAVDLGRGDGLERGPEHVVDDDGASDPGGVGPGPVRLVVDSRPALDRRPGHRRRPVGLPQREPRPDQLHVTSAMKMGGLWMWVIDGLRPTTSYAISNASRRVDAGLHPIPRTARGSAP